MKTNMIPRMTQTLCFMVVALVGLASLAREHEGNRTNSILLNGAWEFARGDGS